MLLSLIRLLLLLFSLNQTHTHAHTSNHLEEAAAGAHVRGLDFIRARHDGGAARFRNAVLVRLAHAPKHGDVGLN